MEICFPDYQNTGLTVVSAVLNAFGVKDEHHQQEDVKRLLSEKTYKKVILMLFDGMGIELISRVLPENSFLRTHMLRELSAAYPSTTTNATSSIECCKTPREHGWLGWTLYFKEIDKLVDIFINRDQNGEEAAPYPVADTYNPREMVFGRFREAGVEGHCVSRFGTDRVSTLDEMRETVLRLCADEKRRYIYCYWGDPDHTMHELGCRHEKIADIVRNINAYVEKLYRSLPEDTLLMVTADHGLVDGEMLYVEDHPELEEMLLRMPSVELRAAAFYVKPEYMEAFPEMFRKTFGEHFLLLTAREFVDKGYLGDGEDNRKLWDFLGDYIALSTDRECIMARHGEGTLIGIHAGLTRDEMRVPLIACLK